MAFVTYILLAGVVLGTQSRYTEQTIRSFILAFVNMCSLFSHDFIFT